MSPDQPTRDRRQLLLAPGAVLNGIDYIDAGPVGPGSPFIS